VGRAEIRDSTTSRLVEQDYAQEATMNRQPAAVIDKAKLPELLHEMIDSRPGCAHHLCQIFLLDSGKHNPGSTFLAKMSQQEENPGQTLLAGIEKLIDEIFPNAFDAFPSLFSTLFLTCSFKDFNLRRRGGVRSWFAWPCLAAWPPPARPEPLRQTPTPSGAQDSA
jgi:hypothetical protein